ncbi:MAG: hypothetical protein CMF23_17885 [Ignavibacteriae bacterium]|nr:hypothetical protein [Ignavibacteriota bacterium]
MLSLIDIEKEKRIRHKERLKDNSTLQLYYRTHPLDYFHERLGINKETIDWSLIPEYEFHDWDGTPNPLMAILNALVENKWVGVESATGCSKTFIAACITFWFLECFENSIVITTAPKQDQLEKNMWKEISRLFPKFGKGYLDTLTLRMKKDDSGKKSYEWAAFGFVSGTSSDKETEDKAQGFHAEHMLIILEETPGIPKSIINSFKLTSQAPHNLILALGNPNHHLDQLHKFCQLGRVEHIRISGLDYPNIVLDNPSFIPGGKSRQGIQDIIDEVGSEDHPFYLSRVRGISPGQSKDSLINLKWCDDAVNRDRKEFMKGEPALGVDVANSEAGDKAAIAEGLGSVLLGVEDFYCPDSNQLGKRDVYEKMKEKKVKADRVGVDGVGVGAGTVNALKELGIKVQNIIGGEKPIKIKETEFTFNNLRSQMYWQMREDLKNGEICLPNDPDLISDLCAPTWKINDKVIIVEGKPEIRKRLGRSPNKGDAAVYWNWVRVPRKPKAEVTVRTV